VILERAIRRVRLPAGSLYVAVPVAGTKIRLGRLRKTLDERSDAQRIGGWLILEQKGPITDRPAIAAGIANLLREARAATAPPYHTALEGYYRLGIDVADGAQRRLRLDRGG